jgi:hypothetical protein
MLLSPRGTGLRIPDRGLVGRSRFDWRKKKLEPVKNSVKIDFFWDFSVDTNII